MEKFGKFSPSRSHANLNIAMMSSPILAKNPRDPRLCDPWNVQERNTASLPPFPGEYAHQSAVQPASYPHFVATPDTGEEAQVTPITRYTTLRPAKLSFSPKATYPKHKPQRRLSYYLMYPSYQALQDNPLQMEDIRTIFASPIIQEQLHYLLMDYSLDEAKISECLQHLGIPRSLFLRYISRVYPHHFYTQLNTLD